MYLHGKGGIGKSQMAAALADYLQRHDKTVWCADCDPSTDTFRRIKSLGVKFYDIMDGDEVNARRFDDLIMEALSSGAEHAVIDSGSGAYQALADYMSQGGMFEALREQGHHGYLHTIVAGGGMMGTTLDGLHNLIQVFPDTRFVVWLNPKNGPMVHDGVHLTEHPDFQQHTDHFGAVIPVPQLNASTYTADLSWMLARGQTYKDVNADPNVNFIIKNRLSQQRRAYDELLDAALSTLEASETPEPTEVKADKSKSQKSKGGRADKSKSPKRRRPN